MNRNPPKNPKPDETRDRIKQQGRNNESDPRIHEAEEEEGERFVAAAEA